MPSYTRRVTTIACDCSGSCGDHEGTCIMCQEFEGGRVDALNAAIESAWKVSTAPRRFYCEHCVKALDVKLARIKAQVKAQLSKDIVELAASVEDACKECGRGDGAPHTAECSVALEQDREDGAL